MKIAAFILSLAFSLTAFSEGKIYEASAGKKIFIDVANQSKIHVQLRTRSKAEDATPVAKLKAQWSGFECQLEDMQLTQSIYDGNTENYHNTWLFTFSYSPGADLSGCIYNIHFADQEKAVIELFMNY